MTIKTWSAQCWCGFVTGMAQIHCDDGRSFLFSGAGCEEKPRRSPKIMDKIVKEKLEELNKEKNSE